MPFIASNGLTEEGTGKIIAAGTPQEIIAKFGRPSRIRVHGSPELAAYLRHKLGVAVTSEDGRVEIELGRKEDALRLLFALDASGLPWDSFATEQDTLEDVFVRLVGRMDEGALKSEAGS
jgi:ABC-type multidrug transport system ATPase subunit